MVDERRVFGANTVVVLEVVGRSVKLNRHLHGLTFAFFEVEEFVVHARGGRDGAVPKRRKVNAVDDSVRGQINAAVAVGDAAIAQNGVEQVEVHAACVDMFCRCGSGSARFRLACDVCLRGTLGVVFPLIIGVSFACDLVAATYAAVGVADEDRHFHTAFESGVFSASHITGYALSAGAVVRGEHDEGVVVKRAAAARIRRGFEIVENIAEIFVKLLDALHVGVVARVALARAGVVRIDGEVRPRSRVVCKEFLVVFN